VPAKISNSRHIGTIIRSMDRMHIGIMDCQVVVAGVAALPVVRWQSNASINSPSNFVPHSSYDSVSVRVVPYSQYAALVLVSTDFVPRSIYSSVSIKKDFSGSSTVQASEEDVRSVVVKGSVDRSVGRCTRLVDRCTRYSVRSSFGRRSYGRKEVTV
jgi:hypothetical protein